MDVDVTVTVPQAAKQVSDALVKLVKDIKSKSSPVADAVSLVETAVADFAELKLEASDPALVILGGLLAGQIVSALIEQPAPAAAAPAAAPAPASS